MGKCINPVCNGETWQSPALNQTNSLGDSQGKGLGLGLIPRVVAEGGILREMDEMDSETYVHLKCLGLS